MSKRETDTNLKFGHAILIQGYRNLNDTVNSKDLDQGFLTAKGYADIKVKYETYEDILYFQNYRDAIFEIIPAGNFEINDEIQDPSTSEEIKKKLKYRAKSQEAQFKLNKEKKLKNTIFFGSEVMFRHLDSDSYLTGTINPSEGDNGAFAVEVTKKLSSNLIFKLLPFRSYQFEGMQIMFDSPVIIKNQKTQTFLTFEKLEKNEEIKKLSQSPVPSKSSFKIPVKIKNEKSKIYSCVSYSTDLSCKKETPMPWKFKLHMVDIVNQKLIQHDIAYFQHTQNQGVLTAFKNEIALKESKKPNTGTLQFYDCLWEIEKNQNIQESQDTENSIYILRHLMSGMTFEFVKKEDEIMDHNISEDLHDIESENIVKGIGKQQIPMLREIASNEKFGTVEIKIAKKEGGQITSESYVHIMNDGKYLTTIKERKNQNEQPITKANFANTYDVVNEEFISKAQKESSYIKRNLALSQETPTHCFKIMEINDETKEEVLFALSFHQTIINLIQDLRWGHKEVEKKIKYYRMIGISKSLKQIKAFIKKCDEEEAEKEEIRPIKKRQEICGDLGMCELLFELLYYMRINKKDVFKDSLNQLEKFEELYSICYEVIEIMVRDNYLLKIHVSKWIDFVIQDVLEKDEPARLAALKEILKGNTLVVNNFIKKQLIQHLYNKIKVSDNPPEKSLGDQKPQMKVNNKQKSQKKKYIEIFRTFCKVNDQPVTKNQNNVLECFIKKVENTQFSFNFKIFKEKPKKKKNLDSIEDENVDILKIEGSINNNFRYRTIEEYFNGTSQEDKESWLYFVQFFNLLADLCYGRNKVVKNYLSKLYDLEILCALLKDPFIGNAYVPLMRLVNYLHVEGENYYPILRINSIRVLDTLKNEMPINVTEAEKMKPWEWPAMKSLLQELKGQLQEFCNLKKTRLRLIFTQIDNQKKLKQKIKKYKLMLTTEEENIKLLVVLSTLLTTVQLGFWRSMEELRQIIMRVEPILLNDTDFIKKLIEDLTIENEIKEKYQQIKNELSVSTNQNLYIMNCKLMATKIIEKILDFEVDSRVFIASKNFIKMTSGIKSNNQFINVKDFKRKMEENKISFDKKVLNIWINEVKTIWDPKVIYFSGQIDIILLELSQYHTFPQLVSQALLIMKRLYDQKKECIKYFQNIFFVESENFYHLANYILKRRSKFYSLLDENTQKADIGQLQTGYPNINRQSNQEKDSGIMQDLFIFSELMKNQKSIDKLTSIPKLNQSGVFNLLNSERLINLTNERETNNKYYQRIVKGSYVHELVIKYIIACREIPKNELSAKLLHLCYIFMTGVIINNQENKLEMLPYIDIVKGHIYTNIGAIDFLKQMYDNNKNMLYCQSQVQKLTTQICDRINELTPSSYYSAKLLDFFRCLIYYNQKALQANQITILKIIQDDVYNNIIVDYSDEYFDKLIEQYEEDNPEPKEGQKLNEYVIMRPQLTYLYTYFQILSALIEDKNVVNRGKLIRKYPFQTLVKYIQKSRKCWPLRRNLRVFLNKMYYIFPGLEFNLKEIQENEFNNLIFDLNNFIKIRNSQKAQDYQNQRFDNPVRFTYIENYMYLNLEEGLNSLYELLHNKAISQEINKIINSSLTSFDLAFQFLRILERLGFIKNYFIAKKNVYTVGLVKHLQHLIQLKIRDWPDFIFQRKDVQITNKVLTKPEKDKARIRLVEKIIQGDIEAFYSRNSPCVDEETPLSFKTPDKIAKNQEKKEGKHLPGANAKLIGILQRIFTTKKKPVVDVNIETNKNMMKISALMRLQDDFKKYLSTQFINFIKKFSNINEESTRLYNSVPYISKYEFVKIIISVNEKNPGVISSDLKIFILKLVTGFISLRNTKKNNDGIEICTIPIDEWQSEDWTKPQDIELFIQEEQNSLKICGLADFICELLSQDVSDDIELANEILLCGIAFLFAGYKVTQEAIVQILKKDDENRVFVNIANLITKLGNLICKNNKKKDEVEENKQRAFSLTTIDTYDYYNTSEKYAYRKNVFEPDDAKEQEYKKMCKTAYKRAFKFIQLLCQNNNLQNKIFIRQQKKVTEEGKEIKKLKSINFIELSTNELRQIFSILCKEICEVPLYILDFLLEVTQIPIIDNQKVLMKSTFFEDLYQMENFFYNKPDNLKKRDFEESDIQTLEQIYRKCVSIILSNFEGNEVSTYKDLDQKLDARFLTDIIDSTLTKKNLLDIESLNVYLKNIKTFKYDEGILTILDVIIIFKKIKEMEPKGNLISRYEQYKKKEENKKKRLVIVELERLLLKIQITHQGKNQLLFFPNYPVFSSLSDQLRNDIMYNAERNTRRDKIVSLYKNMKYSDDIAKDQPIFPIKENIEHSFELERKQNINQSKMKSIKDLSSILAVIITVYLWLTFEVVTENHKSQLVSNDFNQLVVKGLCIIQIICNLYFIYLWYKLKKTKCTSISTIMKDGIQLYGILGVSIFGLYTGSPQYFTIHLLDLCTRFDELQDIIKAINSRTKQLLLVSMLGVAFVFIFDIITFSNYMKNVYTDQDSLDDMCNSIGSCVIDLYISGVIGQSMEQFELQRFIYDLVYGVFFGMLFESIISGLMLDAFASLRDKKDSIDSDKENFCYICNKTRENIEKEGSSFKKHIKQNHFLWNYVFYLYILQEKDASEFTGLEYYIKQRYTEQNVSWLPNAEDSGFNLIQKSEDILKELAAISNQMSKTKQDFEKNLEEYNK